MKLAAPFPQQRVSSDSPSTSRSNVFPTHCAFALLLMPFWMPSTFACGAAQSSWEQPSRRGRTTSSRPHRSSQTRPSNRTSPRARSRTARQNPFRLSGKSDDERCPQRDSRYGRPHLLDGLQENIRICSALHAFQHIAGSMLQRHIQVLADVVVAGDGLQQPAGNPIGIGIKKPQPPSPSIRASLSSNCASPSFSPKSSP